MFESAAAATIDVSRVAGPGLSSRRSSSVHEAGERYSRRDRQNRTRALPTMIATPQSAAYWRSWSACAGLPATRPSASAAVTKERPVAMMMASTLDNAGQLQGRDEGDHGQGG